MMLVNDVLDFSRLEAKRLTLEDTELDMVTLVDEAIGLHAPDAQRKQLHLLAMVYDDVPTPVRGDPLRITQVLNNLVGNALKFTPTGGVIVRIMLDDQADDEDRQYRVLRISVSDTGIGMSQAHKTCLFQAFTQAEPGHAREFGGSGLGLSICRRLVQQMGGEISVESEPNGGSTFAFTLPLLASGAAERPVELALPRGTTVTLHEPHAPTHFALTHLIERWGGRVNAASTAANTDQPADPQLCVLALTQADLSPERRTTWQAYIHAAGCPTLVLANATGLDTTTFTFPHGGELLDKPCGRDELAAALTRLLASPSVVDMHRQEPPAPISQPVRQLLVVDDNASNRLLLKSLLESAGGQQPLQIHSAPSGHAALDLARHAQCPFDMVLMDIRMPDMSGLQTTQALRRLNSSWARCPIIAVTAHALKRERRQWLTEGFDDVLIKPAEERQLQALLHRFLDTRRNPHPAPTARATTPAAEAATVDLTLGTQLAGGNKRQAQRQLDDLVESLGQSECEMRLAHDQADLHALLEAVHRLNGASRYCGVPALSLKLAALETRLRTDGMVHADQPLEEVYQAIRHLYAKASGPTAAASQPSLRE